MRVKLLVFLVFAFFIAACLNAPKEQGNTPPNKAADPNKKIKIGFSMATVKEERWQRDHNAFEARCKELNVDCDIQVADNKTEKQANDVDNLLTKGIDVLVIAPQDATQAATLVDKAKAKGVPVISY